MGKVMGVEWAPLGLPMDRRLQTFSVLFWITTFLFFGSLFTYILAYLFTTWYWWVSVLYLSWMCYDLESCQKGGRSGIFVRFVRGWRIWKHYVNYFPIQFVKTCDFDPKKNYLIGSHPHGILCSGAFACFATEGANFSEKFPGMTARLLTLEGMYWVPGYRELILCSGACAATAKGITNLMTTPGGGTISVLMVGGVAESMNSDKDKIKLVLRGRKGFIKLALRNGVELVPSFSFGEAFIYEMVPNHEGTFLRRAQNFLRRFIGIAPIIFFGRGIFQYALGLIPHRKPITLVVGEPIHVERVEDPTPEQVDSLHERYMEALQKLYDENNPKYGNPDIQLVM